MNTTFVGLSGTNGAGKDTVGELLASRYGFYFMSITELLREEARHRGLSVERVNLRKISGEWRRRYGLGVLVDKAQQHFKPLQSDYQGLAIASLRHPAEAEAVHNSGGVVLWIDADLKIRYQRVRSADQRNRGSEDNISFEEFVRHEQAEMHPENNDNTSLNMQAVKDRADYIVYNQGSLADLEHQLQQLLGLKAT